MVGSGRCRSAWLLHSAAAPVRGCGLFVPKAERHARSVSRSGPYLLADVHWSPPVSVQDRVGCHSVCHSAVARSRAQHDRRPAIKPVVGDGSNLLTVRFSGVADAQLRPDVREYMVVHGCLRALMAAVVAVTVAAEISADLPLLGRGVNLARSLSIARLRARLAGVGLCVPKPTRDEVCQHS